MSFMSPRDYASWFPCRRILSLAMLFVPHAVMKKYKEGHMLAIHYVAHV